MKHQMVTRSRLTGSTSMDGACLSPSGTIEGDIRNKRSTSNDGARLISVKTCNPCIDEAHRSSTVNHVPVDDSFSFASSCHVFASNGNSSKITRYIMEACIVAVSTKKMSRKKNRRRLNKARKIASLPKVESGPDTTFLLENAGKKHVYFSGSSLLNLPSLPADTVQFSVYRHLNPFICSRGGSLPGVFTFLPREWTRRVFSGGPSICEYYTALAAILSRHPKMCPRGKARVPVFEEGSPSTYFTAGTSPSRNQRGLVPVARHLPRMPEERALLDRYFAKVEHAAMAFIDSKSISAVAFAKRVSGYQGYQYSDGRESSIWSAIAIAENVAMNMHRDNDFFLGAASVITNELFGQDERICQFFCFPEHGRAVGMRNGDIVLFNPRKSHCISGRCDSTRNVVCTSFYLKTAVVGGNDNCRNVDQLSMFV